MLSSRVEPEWVAREAIEPVIAGQGLELASD